MKVIGLTGGIATGKSTVSRMLTALGAHVLDADEIAREVVDVGTPGLQQVANRFPGVLDAAGRLDRAALGARVFADEAERKALNAILHPLIQEQFLIKSQALADQGVEVVVYDAALLIENRLHELMDGVMLVSAPPELQIERLQARNHLTRDEALARIATQLPLSAKAPHARWIIDNSGTLSATQAQVAQAWREATASS